MDENYFLYDRHQSKNKSLIVLVHGLMGNINKTWGKFPTLVKNDAKYKNFNIARWGYTTKLSAVLKYRLLSLIPIIGDKVPNVESVAETFLSKIEYESNANGYRDIWLIGHSLGTLIILKSLQIAINNENKDIRIRYNVISYLRKIILYASPIKGVKMNTCVSKIHPQARYFKANTDEIYYLIS